MTAIATIYDSTNQEIPLEVVFSRKRKRSIGMAVNQKWVVVRAPYHCPKMMVKKFITAKEQWIIKQRERQQWAESTIEYDDNWIPLAMHHMGKQLPIYLRAHEKKRALVTFSWSAITIAMPATWIEDIGSSQENIKKALEKRQRKEANRYLTERTALLAEELSLRVWAIIIKTYKRKYGQCKGDEISLDWKLIRFPIAISDHIIYHELAHLTHKHHQKSFWNLLATYDPGTPTHKKRLKDNWVAVHNDW